MDSTHRAVSPTAKEVNLVENFGHLPHNENQSGISQLPFTSFSETVSLKEDRACSLRKAAN